MARDKIPEEWGPFVPDGHVGPGWAVGPLGIRVGVRVPSATRYSTAAPSANIRIAHRSQQISESDHLPNRLQRVICPGVGDPARCSVTDSRWRRRGSSDYSPLG